MKNIIISLCALLAFSTVGCVKQTIERRQSKKSQCHTPQRIILLLLMRAT